MPGRDAAERAQLLRIAVLLGGPALLIGAFAVFFVWVRADLHPAYLLLGLMLLFPLTWGLILLVEAATSHGAYGVVTELHAGRATPRTPGFSRQEALAAQGRLEESAAAYRDHLTDAPSDVAAWIALGRLLAGPLSDASGAEAAYLSGRRVGAGPGWERIIGNDLIDLYQRMGDDGRMQVELARYASLNQGTREGTAAAQRLRALKSGGRPPSPHGGEGDRG
jgi:hypothetical protein